MAYVDKNLLPGEEVIHRGEMHWVVYLPGLVFFFGGLYLFASALAMPGSEGAARGATSAVSMLIGIFVLITEFIRRRTTEARRHFQAHHRQVWPRGPENYRAKPYQGRVDSRRAGRGG